jgi:hypothetical protein
MDNVVIEKLFSTLANERTNQTKYMNGDAARRVRHKRRFDLPIREARGPSVTSARPHLSGRPALDSRFTTTRYNSS